MCSQSQQLLGDLGGRFLALSSISEVVGSICRVVHRNLPKLCVGYSENPQPPLASHDSVGGWQFLHH